MADLDLPAVFLIKGILERLGAGLVTTTRGLVHDEHFCHLICSKKGVLFTTV